MKLNQVEFELSAEAADRLAYFQAVYSGFQRAKIAGVINRYYNIGGYTVCLRFAGEGLIPQVTPALEHLVVQPTDKPALTICLWDRDSTGVKLPLLVDSFISLLHLRWWELLDIRGEIKGFSDSRIKTAFHLGPNILSVLDTQQNLALYWVNTAKELPYYETGSPLRTILNWWMEMHQRRFIHGGAIGNVTGGVLLIGKGGSGKSTSALACLNSELLYASDDYCLVKNGSTPYVYSLYNTAKLKGIQDVKRFPHLAAKISNTSRLDTEKAMLFVHQHYPEKVVSGFPLRAILLPRVTGEKDTSLQPSSTAAALKAIAPSTIFQLPSNGKQAFQDMVNLVKQLPCYYLNAGTDLSQIPKVILELLSTL